MRLSWLENASTSNVIHTTVSHILAKHTVAKEYRLAPPSLTSRNTVNNPLKVPKQATNITIANTNDLKICPSYLERDNLSSNSSVSRAIPMLNSFSSDTDNAKLSFFVLAVPDCMVERS